MMDARRCERVTTRYADHIAVSASSHMPGGDAGESGSANVTSATMSATLFRINSPTAAARRSMCRRDASVRNISSAPGGAAMRERYDPPPSTMKGENRLDLPST